MTENFSEIINEIVHNNRKILTERIFIKWK